jgi:hypothetical protein
MLPFSMDLPTFAGKPPEADAPNAPETLTIRRTPPVADKLPLRGCQQERQSYIAGAGCTSSKQQSRGMNASQTKLRRFRAVVPA